jgi:hypothetical protein
VRNRVTARRQALGIKRRQQRVPPEALRIISENAALLAANDVANYLQIPALNNRLVRAGLYVPSTRPNRAAAPPRLLKSPSILRLHKTVDFGTPNFDVPFGEFLCRTARCCCRPRG